MRDTNLENLYGTVFNFSYKARLSLYYSLFLVRNKMYHIIPYGFSRLNSLLIQYSPLINDVKFLHLQLCLALTDLALQMSSWQKPVVDLINRFGGNTAHLWPLLEIMTVFPEEVNSRSLRYNVISY